LFIVIDFPLIEIMPSSLNLQRTRVALSLDKPIRLANSCRENGGEPYPLLVALKISDSISNSLSCRNDSEAFRIAMLKI
jgi:hypothetical protein